MFTKKILAAAITSQPSANGVADAIDFDGATDYLSRSSDLMGNADGKTFTFSAWVWSDLGEGCRLYSSGTSATADGQVQFWVSATGVFHIQIAAANASTSKLRIDSPAGAIPKNTFTHILVSIDMNQSWTTAKLYVNDVLVPWQTVTSYVNEALNFTNPLHTISASPVDLSVDGKQRLAHVFLDYTYRDLSIEANRRLFITADRKPAANQAALNPILYLPLNDPTQPGKNLGTGGDFTLNGVVARSGRGPSQFNAPYSDLDGAADYLSRVGGLSGVSDGRLVSAHCNFQMDVIDQFPVWAGVGAANKLAIGTVGGKLFIQGGDTASGVAFRFTSTDALVIGRNYLVTLSCDLANTGNRHVYLNGASCAGSWIYNNTNIDFTCDWYIGRDNSTAYYNGRLGNVFFDTRYIDLSQPANLAKFVTGTGIDAKPADLGANGEKPFGTPPLIYLPMYGNNAGKNYGTGGDFTVNSGPFAGARGPNEYWGNWAKFPGSPAQYIGRSSSLAISNSNKFSFSGYYSSLPSGVGRYLLVQGDGMEGINININGSNQYVVTARNAAGTFILGATVTSPTAVLDGSAHNIQIAIDLSDTAKRFVYVDGVAASVTWSTYTSDAINFLSTVTRIGPSYSDKFAEFYFTTDYIDFSQEANRLKFRDAFGNPVDLRPQIATGTLPNPAIYMRFDPSNFGKNEGTGGDFVVNGTITDGGQL